MVKLVKILTLKVIGFVANVLAGKINYPHKEIHYMTFKFLLPATFAIASLNAFATEPFDITQWEFDQGIKYQSSIEPPYDTIDVYAGVSQHFITMLQGMERYAEEMSDWSDAVELQQDYLYVKSLNADLTDNTAYAILVGSTFKIDTNGDGTANKRYRPGDYFSGSDWDNDGKIDILEHQGYFTYNDSIIRVR